MDHGQDSIRRNCLTAPRKARHVRRAVVALGMAAASMVATSGVAGADASLSVSPAGGLDPAGAFVVVSGNGFAPNAQLFVMQCRSTSTDDHTCNSVGLRKVTTDANGAFTANAMRLVARFGATDCTASACSVMTSAVSGHSEDRSQDRVAPIQFAAPVPAPTQPAPPPAAPDPAPTPDTAPPSPAEPAAPAAPGSTVDAGTATTASTVPGTPSSDPASDPGDIDAATEGTAERGGDDEVAGDDVTTTDDEVATALAVAGGSIDDTSGGGGSSTALIVAGGALLAAVAGGSAVAVRRRRSTAT